MALETAYVSFDHPDGWKCELSQGVWICQATAEPERRESVILAIATQASEWDTLENYVKYLSDPRTIKDDQGKQIRGKVTYARKRNINGVNWVDSLQHNSELPGFWARYAATVQNKLAILVTYIVSDEQYSKLAPQFERMISSLKPKADFDISVASKQGDGPLPGGTKVGPLQKSILAERLNVQRTPVESVVAEESTDDGGAMTAAVLGGGVVAAAGGYLYFRRRQSRKRKEPASTDSKKKRVG